jgi:hypothetical protein
MLPAVPDSNLGHRGLCEAVWSPFWARPSHVSVTRNASTCHARYTAPQITLPSVACVCCISLSSRCQSRYTLRRLLSTFSTLRVPHPFLGSPKCLPHTFGVDGGYDPGSATISSEPPMSLSRDLGVVTASRTCRLDGATGKPCNHRYLRTPSILHFACQSRRDTWYNCWDATQNA